MDSTTADEINSVAKALGVRVRMVDAVRGGTANAQYQGSDILVEKNNPNPVMQVVGHEWTHRVQELAPEQYRAFRDSVTSLPEVQAAAETLLEIYREGGEDIDYEGALDEATANFAGEMIANTDVLNDFIRQHSGDRTLLEKLRDALHELVQKLTGKAKKQAQTAERMLQEAFEAAAQQAEKNSKNADGLTGNRYNDTILDNKYSMKEDIDNEREERSYKGIHGNRYENRQESGRGTNGGVRGNISNASGRHGRVDSSFGEKPRFNWAENGVVQPQRGSVAAEAQETAIGYGVPSFVISDEVWDANYKGSPAFSVGGQIYFRENMPEKNRGMLAPHEITHVMRQTEYPPYLDFIKRTPDMLNLSDDVTRILLEHTAKHQNTTIEEADFTRLYDEFNATVYGHIAANKADMFTSGVGSNVFRDFAAYSNELAAIHEQFRQGRISGSEERIRAKKFSLKGAENAQELAALRRENEKLRERVRIEMSV